MISISLKDFEVILCRSWTLDVRDQRIDRLLTLWAVALASGESELCFDIDFLMDVLIYQLTPVWM